MQKFLTTSIVLFTMLFSTNQTYSAAVFSRPAFARQSSDNILMSPLQVPEGGSSGPLMSKYATTIIDDPNDQPKAAVVVVSDKISGRISYSDHLKKFFIINDGENDHYKEASYHISNADSFQLVKGDIVILKVRNDNGTLWIQQIISLEQKVKRAGGADQGGDVQIQSLCDDEDDDNDDDDIDLSSSGKDE